MIRKAALRETITLFVTSESEDAPLVDRYGDPIIVEAEGVDVPAAVQPIGRGNISTGSELEIDRDTRISRYTVMVPPDTPVDGLANVEWRGTRYEVVGEPLVFTTRGASPHHLEFTIRVIEG